MTCSTQHKAEMAQLRQTLRRKEAAAANLQNWQPTWAA